MISSYPAAPPASNEPAVKVAVIIPYFQERAGILRRALDSVIKQAGALRLVTIVVDDQSPIAADGECEAIRRTSIPITIIRQRNSGPGAARNAALDALPSDCRYVAFLDSDDEWAAGHLENAVAALEKGHDFYFANFFQLDQKIGAFERRQRIDPTKNQLLPVGKNLYRFTGDLFTQTITGNVIGTSTVVARSTLVANVRFRPEFRHAGEDYLFWLDCARRTSSIAFGTDIECTYGRGVNVYAGSGWNTPRSLDRIVDETRYRRAIMDQYELSAEQRLHLRAVLRMNRRAFAADVMHRATHGMPIRRELLRAQWAADPLSFLALLYWPLIHVLQKS